MRVYAPKCCFTKGVLFIRVEAANTVSDVVMLFHVRAGTAVRYASRLLLKVPR